MALAIGQNLTKAYRDTRSEIRKVVWPTREETTNLTLVVIGMSVVIAAFLGAADFLFSNLIRLLNP